mmetsp:Transcript_35284/g.77250  ORF Transcript_35284/g.77250 Transcript_35284/m.77250 type:complete len:147 (-) Transcript_35284:229-669(-)
MSIQTEQGLEKDGKLAPSRVGSINRSLLTPTGTALRNRVDELEAMVDFQLNSARSQMLDLRRGQSGEANREAELRREQMLEGMKGEIQASIDRTVDELKQVFAQQRAEGSRISALIADRRKEHLSLQQQLVGLQRRLQDVEESLGE